METPAIATPAHERWATNSSHKLARVVTATGTLATIRMGAIHLEARAKSVWLWPSSLEPDLSSRALRESPSSSPPTVEATQPRAQAPTTMLPAEPEGRVRRDPEEMR